MIEEKPSDLKLKYRPPTLEQFYGGGYLIPQVETYVTNEAKSHAILITGPSGCGKTTLGRIIARMMGSSLTPPNFLEFDLAAEGGVDAAKKRIVQTVKWMPTVRQGEVRIKVYLLDECFAPGTMVESDQSGKRIENFRKGDSIYSVGGLSVVENVAVNKVSLDRVARVVMSNGTVLFTTKQHEFLMERGWSEVQDLCFKDFTFAFNRHIMSAITLDGRDSNGPKEMRGMSGNVHCNRNQEEVLFQGLFKGSCSEDSLCKEQEGEGDCTLPSVRKGDGGYPGSEETILFQRLHGEVLRREKKEPLGGDEVRALRECISFPFQEEEILQPDLRGEMEEYPSSCEGSPVQRFCQEEDRRSFIKNNVQSGTEGSFLRTDEGRQPHVQTGDRREDDERKKDQRNASCLPYGEGREWKVDGTSDNALRHFGMANGGGSISREEEGGLSDLLQVGCGEFEPQDRDRNRRKWSQVESCFFSRFQEDGSALCVGVESIEIYQPGSNDELFKGIIGDRERSQGYVEFYDLQVKGHPSYFAEGIPVHNCHMLTKQGASALLKTIEEPPPFVYFVFCTTNPEKVLDTIITRCQKFEVRPLSQEETQCLVEDVCEAEGIDLPKVVLRRIVAEANGCSREALNLINTVRGLPENVALEAIGGSLETEITQMCSLLLDGRIKDKWTEMRRKLEKFNGDPEKARLGVLTYMRKVVMGERATLAQLRRADDIVSVFWNPFDRNGLSGFILAMRAACNSISGGEE